MDELRFLFSWNVLIFLIVLGLISFFLMEFSLDKEKREEDGTLRIKRKCFVVRFISFPKEPKNLGQFFVSIYVGMLFEYLVIVTLCLILYQLYMTASANWVRPIIFFIFESFVASLAWIETLKDK